MGCWDASPPEVDVASVADVTKRINPDSTTAAFELGKPSWDVAAYGGADAVHSPDGSISIARGTFVVERKKGHGTYKRILNGTTHRGVDIPDGTYRVTSQAPNVPAHVEEVTFP